MPLKREYPQYPRSQAQSSARRRRARRWHHHAHDHASRMCNPLDHEANDDGHVYTTQPVCLPGSASSPLRAAGAVMGAAMGAAGKFTAKQRSSGTGRPPSLSSMRWRGRSGAEHVAGACMRGAEVGLHFK